MSRHELQEYLVRFHCGTVIKEDPIWMLAVLTLQFQLVQPISLFDQIVANFDSLFRYQRLYRTLVALGGFRLLGNGIEVLLIVSPSSNFVPHPDIPC